MSIIFQVGDDGVGHSFALRRPQSWRAVAMVAHLKSVAASENDHSHRNERSR
jgi:hypothetical protein